MISKSRLFVFLRRSKERPFKSKTKVNRLLLILSISFLSISWGQQNDWDKRAKFSGEKRARAISFSIGDFGYVGTGEDTTEMTHNDLWRFDPSSNSWMQVASLPGSTRRNAIAVTIGDFGYVGMGADSSSSSLGLILSDWWQYNPLTNSWVQKADYPGGYDMFNNTDTINGIYFGTAFEIADMGYVCGGKMGPNFYGTDLWEYSPTLDQWTRKADFPGFDRFQLSSFSIDDKGYVGMGVDHDLYRKDWWQYDPLTDNWLQVADLPGVERGAASTFVLGQRGFLVFGTDGGYKDELWEYNPFTNSWMIRANFPADGRKNGIAFAIGDSAYAGIGNSANGKRRNFYRYYPLLPVGLEENQVKINIFPNPASNYISIQTTSNKVIVQLVDLHGKEIFRSSGTTIDVSSISSGTYILNIFGENNRHLDTQKVIIL
jgi:N-acetylneuraminic acid mutarotase